MAVYFLDTSALVKRYVAEVGSDRVRSVVGEAGVTLVIADLARVEFASALRRRVREGEVTEDQQRALKIAFAIHLVRDYLVSPIRSDHITSACTLVDQHTLRACDAIQLAVALSARDLLQGTEEEFAVVSADRNLSEAARAEQVAVIDLLVI